MSSIVHIRRTIVVEYDVDRADYDLWERHMPADYEIERMEKDREFDYFDITPEIVTSHTTEVTFR